MAKNTEYTIPENAPKADEVYRHYKGDLYRVIFLTGHNDPDELCVVYEPVQAGEHGFERYSRLLSSWQQEVEWNGGKVVRFSKVESL
jgi:hypothetical protein